MDRPFVFWGVTGLHSQPSLVSACATATASTALATLTPALLDGGTALFRRHGIEPGLALRTTGFGLRALFGGHGGKPGFTGGATFLATGFMPGATLGGGCRCLCARLCGCRCGRRCSGGGCLGQGGQRRSGRNGQQADGCQRSAQGILLGNLEGHEISLL
jgi:hypothetical protein